MPRVYLRDTLRMRTVNEEHLKLIQGVIARMAGNSFLLKGWAVTLVSGLSAFAVADADRNIAWLAAAAGTVFGGLDAMYLANERAFRKLYYEALKLQLEEWHLQRAPLDITDFFKALCSWSVLPIHMVTVAGSVVVATAL